MITLLRLIILGVIAFAAYRYLRKLVRSAFLPPRQQTRNERGPDKALFQGEMVRDPVCNAYLAKERALTASKEGDLHYFCSESCRKAFLQGAVQNEHGSEQGKAGP